MAQLHQVILGEMFIGHKVRLVHIPGSSLAALDVFLLTSTPLEWKAITVTFRAVGHVCTVFDD